MQIVEPHPAAPGTQEDTGREGPSSAAPLLSHAGPEVMPQRAEVLCHRQARRHHCGQERGLEFGAIASLSRSTSHTCQRGAQGGLSLG